MENQNLNSENSPVFDSHSSVKNVIEKRRTFIPISFGLIIIMFFFTFCTFSCGGQKIDSVSGINLVTGTRIENKDSQQNQSQNNNNNEKIPANMWAFLAYSAAIVGAIFFLFIKKKESLIGVIAGATGVTSLIILQIVIKGDVYGKYKDSITADFKFGYWAALILFIVAGVLCLLQLIEENKTSKTLSPVNKLKKYCTNCGKELENNFTGQFCKNCGNKI